MLTGRKFDAGQAERYGLLVDLTEPDDLVDTARSDSTSSVLPVRWDASTK